MFLLNVLQPYFEVIEESYFAAAELCCTYKWFNIALEMPP
jgi:hypothetical protein